VRIRLPVALIGLAIAKPAFAETKFFAFSGPPHEQIGEGGLTVQKSGIDFFTDGFPAQRYRIVGLIRDKNTCSYPEQPPISYGRIAKIAGRAGATAVILLPHSATAVDLNNSIPERLTAKQALARAGIRAEGNSVALAPEALTYRKPEILIGAAECGELRFVAVRYLAASDK
jgi:hypothetical protein